jgi:hypothetical protein
LKTLRRTDAVSGELLGVVLSPSNRFDLRCCNKPADFSIFAQLNFLLPFENQLKREAY